MSAVLFESEDVMDCEYCKFNDDCDMQCKDTASSPEREYDLLQQHEDMFGY